MLVACLIGIWAGILHVVAGPDHVAAVAPLAGTGARRPWAVGVRWGLGHSGAVAMVACAALYVRDLLPLEPVSEWSERLVGVVLIGVGAWGFHRSVGRGLEHVHEAREPGAAFAIGTLHGLAGSSHLLGVIPALAQPTTAESLANLAGFALGTVASMAAFAAAVGGLGRSLGATGRRRFSGALSAAAIAVGVVWLALAV
jgi:hypothetical protein